MWAHRSSDATHYSKSYLHKFHMICSGKYSIHYNNNNIIIIHVYFAAWSFAKGATWGWVCNKCITQRVSVVPTHPPPPPVLYRLNPQPLFLPGWDTDTVHKRYQTQVRIFVIKPKDSPKAPFTSRNHHLVVTDGTVTQRQNYY